MAVKNLQTILAVERAEPEELEMAEVMVVLEAHQTLLREFGLMVAVAVRVVMLALAALGVMLFQMVAMVLVVLLAVVVALITICNQAGAAAAELGY